MHYGPHPRHKDPFLQTNSRTAARGQGPTEQPHGGTGALPNLTAARRHRGIAQPNTHLQGHGPRTRILSYKGTAHALRPLCRKCSSVILWLTDI